MPEGEIFNKVSAILMEIIGGRSPQWKKWEEYKGYYLNELLPEKQDFVTDQKFNPKKADEDDKRIYKLFQILSFDEWNDLREIFVEFKEGRLREFETDKKQRLEREREERLQLNAEKEAKQKREQFELSIRNLHEQFEINYLNAESFWKEHLLSNISEEEYFNQRAIFVQKWVKNNLDQDVDLEQSGAAGHTEGHAIVTARAGSGKTTTIVSRAIFLQRHCGVSPDRILLLVFNKSAAQEIIDRLKINLGDSVPHVMTFHALAHAIVHPEERLLYDEPEGSKALSRCIQSIIDARIKSDSHHEEVRSVMSAHFRSDWDKIIEGRYDKEMEGFLKYRRSLQFRSLNGDYVKSHGERFIANILFENNVTYSYEKNFKYEKNSKYKKSLNYKPDFTIYKGEKSGVIIEYFGMEGQPDYDEESDKKRNYWSKEDNWEFLELSIDDIKKGEDFLKNKIFSVLNTLEISHSALSDEEIWIQIKDRAIDNFTKTVKESILRCRQLCIDPEGLDKLIMSSELADRSVYDFWILTNKIYRDYLDHLNEVGEEDFCGLMQRAANEIRKGVTTFERSSGGGDLGNITYLGLDEFQDFSELFWEVLKNVLKRNTTINVFSVGDDWQAINRFAGSDLRFFKFYDEYFNSPKEYWISTNYRSERKIVEVGNALMKSQGITCNANSRIEGNVVLVDSSEFEPDLVEEDKHGSDHLTPLILRILDKIFKHGEKTVLLSRKKTAIRGYASKGDSVGLSGNALERYLGKLRSFLPNEKKESINISTSHSYKGSERTNVIILDAVEGSYPLIHSNWIFHEILGENIQKIIDDEKRLFYVALTRAKKNIFVITDKKKRSPFLDEIEENISFDEINWDNYPACEGKSEIIIIKVMNEGSNSESTKSIKELLKGSGYRWKPVEWTGWRKAFIKKKFSIDAIKGELWSKSANGVEVFVEDGYENTLGRYLIRNGYWIEHVGYKSN